MLALAIIAAALGLAGVVIASLSLWWGRRLDRELDTLDETASYQAYASQMRIEALERQMRRHHPRERQHARLSIERGGP